MKPPLIPYQNLFKHMYLGAETFEDTGLWTTPNAASEHTGYYERINEIKYQASLLQPFKKTCTSERKRL